MYVCIYECMYVCMYVRITHYSLFTFCHVTVCIIGIRKSHSLGGGGGD